MKCLIIFIVLVTSFICSCSHTHFELKRPTVLISILARNKAHTLPYFLTALEDLNYPKNRLALWIRTDNNFDKTEEILQLWVSSMKPFYHSINIQYGNDTHENFNQEGPAHWTEERFKHIINLRETSLNHARTIWADYFFTIDCDVFLTNKDTLNYLIAKNLSVVSPMLKSDGLYSNFWFGMTDEYYYQRTEGYLPVLNRENTGCFEVPMIHTCVLIDLRREESDFLTYSPDNVINFDGPIDDIITFAISANRSNVPLNLCNEEAFGYVIIPLEQNDALEFDYEQLVNVKLEVMNEREPLEVSRLLRPFARLPLKDSLGFDKIFMINLARRPERRRRMERCFDELGLEVITVSAVDGKALNKSSLDHIKFLPEYVDPYHNRPMTLGEIGCFLSHYNIWKEIIDKQYKTALLLEDDVRFETFFRRKVISLMEEVNKIPDWDLVYLGRKRLQDQDEPPVGTSNNLVKAGYSYWTLGYALSSRGARKLLAAEPLASLVPVDEYLPILFDKHPQTIYKGYFPNRNLRAYSAAPLLVYPTHYTGEKGYISDTENSTVVPMAAPVPRDDL